MSLIYSSWNNCSLKDTKYITKAYCRFLDTYLLGEGFVGEDSIYIHSKYPNNWIMFKNIAQNIQFDFYFKEAGDTVPKVIWLNRYVNYPALLDIPPVVNAPNPSWGLGFIENMINSMRDGLLPLLLNKGPEFYNLVEEFFEYRALYISENKNLIFTEKTVEDMKRKLLEIPMIPVKYSFEKKKEKS